MSSGLDRDRRWSFVTNHARVLAYIAEHPNARLRDIAAAVGITERTAGQIVTDLEQAGYLSKSRDGRRNQYALAGLATGQAIALLLDLFERQPLV
jgi:DNA-binding MarR family transcriptional regulator